MYNKYVWGTKAMYINLEQKKQQHRQHIMGRRRRSGGEAVPESVFKGKDSRTLNMPEELTFPTANPSRTEILTSHACCSEYRW